MTVWDIVAFLGMGFITIITGLIEASRRRMEKDIDNIGDSIRDLREKDEKFVSEISMRIHRTEWDRFVEKQDNKVNEIFKLLAEIRDALHQKQDRSNG